MNYRTPYDFQGDENCRHIDCWATYCQKKEYQAIQESYCYTMQRERAYQLRNRQNALCTMNWVDFMLVMEGV